MSGRARRRTARRVSPLGTYRGATWRGVRWSAVRRRRQPPRAGEGTDVDADSPTSAALARQLELVQRAEKWRRASGEGAGTALDFGAHPPHLILKRQRVQWVGCSPPTRPNGQGTWQAPGPELAFDELRRAQVLGASAGR
eukprot:2326567-Pleurochrysis_carterae.AAC.3